MYAIVRVSLETIDQANSHHISRTPCNELAKLDKQYDVVVKEDAINSAEFSFIKDPVQSFLLCVGNLSD